MALTDLQANLYHTVTCAGIQNWMPEFSCFMNCMTRCMTIMRFFNEATNKCSLVNYRAWSSEVQAHVSYKISNDK